MRHTAVDLHDDIYTGGEQIVEQLKAWIFAIMAAAICLTVLDALVPKGTMRSIAKMTGGLVMFLVVLRPLTGGKLPEALWEYDSCRQSVNDQIDTYRESYLQEMEAIIEERTGAYILEKAAQMGFVCTVRVEAEPENGVPIPSSVTLNIPKNDDFALWIEQEIGIGETKQIWEGTQ